MSKKNYVPLLYSILSGALAFTIASIIVFVTVAFAERQLYQLLGLLGAYIFWIILFISSGTILLYRLVRRIMSLPRFAIAYSVSFVLYSLAWMMSYYNMRNSTGEWVGSLTGSFAIAISFAVFFALPQYIARWTLFFFVLHSIGYFIGSNVFAMAPSRETMILWGITYGLGTGAGLGFILYYVKEHFVLQKAQIS
ncbi:hypothetical protein [Candidatus Uabimicrobium amorphum]|uniref:Uncharacterized protein n=1 Tax=Uabimicrobium amorphum TaxID=2596890 RepID=A0A5S9IL96_UABAM|nr:hypothetical protein [Candidatus Uabimicrobium amorphum]BBM83516.1 hypothetical protein UABAM_01868 [Candidatus Uabimicrobium amorphum]